ncbi:heterokaryon incompatibility protein-domain-containing protein [Hypoxylon cercidicola]|nr:heterokaryon incompatibility protein-domain-containing protein [Hypoxylon cercidicola]
MSAKTYFSKLFDTKTNTSLKPGFTRVPLTDKILYCLCGFCRLLSIGPDRAFKPHGLGIERGSDLLLSKSDVGLALACMKLLCGERRWGESIRFVAEITSEAFINGDVAGALLHNTGSSDSFNLVRGWFRSCQQRHVECNKTLEGVPLENKLELPTRVIYTGSADSGFVRLFETHNSPGRWAALSHCWGDKQPICTTRDNLQKHKEGISLSDLPSTFRDAVAITRSLGLDYLWIDTICIIQRDPEDWKIEAPKMGQVYEHADIVIVAAGASNAYEGCFVNLPSLQLLELPYVKDGIMAGGLFATRETILPRKNVFRPLSDRAWTIQERVLSRRTVYYTAEGIWWNCRHFGATCFRHDGVSFEDIQLTPRHQSWSGLLTQYLSCALSVPTDNLQAIEGIARRMAPQRPDRYYHGCWMNDLPEQLLWYGKAPRSPELMNRPSWSWSSTGMGKRVFLDERTLKILINLSGPFKPYAANGLRVRSFVYAPVRLAKPKKIDYSLKMELNTLVGSVQGDPHVVVRQDGNLVVKPKEDEDEIPNDLVYLILNDKDNTVGVAVMDDTSWLSQKINMSSELSLILLACAPNWKWLRDRPVASDQMNLYYCLLTLKRRVGQKLHCRIGFAVVYSRAYAEQAIAQDIILV